MNYDSPNSSTPPLKMEVFGTETDLDLNKGFPVIIQYIDFGIGLRPISL